MCTTYHSDSDPNKVNWLALLHDADDKPQQYAGNSYTPFEGLPYQRGGGYWLYFSLCIKLSWIINKVLSFRMRLFDDFVADF